MNAYYTNDYISSNRVSVGPGNVIQVENGIIKSKCPKCLEEFPQDALKFHMMVGKDGSCSENIKKTKYLKNK